MFGLSRPGIIVLAICLIIGAILLYFALRPQKRTTGTQPERFNRSRWKLKLIRDTRRQFEKRDWKVTTGRIVGGLDVDLFVSSKMISLTVLCLDRTLSRFMSETRILEQLEEYSRKFRVRNETALIVTDSGFRKGLTKTANDREVLLVDVNDLHIVTDLVDYTDKLPDALTDIERRVLEGSFGACLTFADKFKKAGNLDKAVYWTRCAIKSRYGYSVQHMLFSLLIESGDLDEAEKVGNDALSFQPKDIARFFQGFQKIATLRGDAAAALGWAERWIATEPDEPMAYDNLATLYQQRNDGPGAAAAIRDALRLAPANPGLLRKAARIALQNGDLPLALSHAEEWVAQAPQDSGAYEFLSDIHLRQKNYDQATAAITTALTLQPDNPHLVRRASIVALDRGDFVKAAELAERFQSMAPQDAGACDHLSVVYLRAGQYGKAQEASAKALALDPGNQHFLRRAAQIQAKLS